MSGKTPGQRAYEAYAGHLAKAVHSILGDEGWPTWDDEAMSPRGRVAWEAAAKAAVPGFSMLVDEARALVAEILDHLDTAGIIVDGELRTAWSERAGLKPAIVGAGTEYLIDPGNPDAWQRVADMPAREGA